MGKSAGQVVGSVLQVAAIALFVMSGNFGAAAAMAKVFAAATMIAGGYLSSQGAKGKQNSDGLDFKFETGGHMINTRSTTEPVPLLFGDFRAGGDQAFMTCTGASNEMFHLIQTIGEGPMDLSNAVVYLDDKTSDDPFYTGYAWVEIFNGAYDQGVCESLRSYFPDWEDAMRGTAYIYVRLKYDQNKFQSVPLITIKGKFMKLFDPRSGQTAWSDNGPLVVYSLMRTRNGINIPYDVIDEQSVIDAANRADALGYKYNGIINGNDPALDIIDKAQLNFRGFIPWADGIYKIRIYDYDSPVMTIAENEIIEDSDEIELPGLPETPNRLTVKFMDPAQKYTINKFTYADNTAVSLDGMEREDELNLIGTADYQQATELATYHLERRRLNKTYPLAIGPKGHPLEVGDCLSITNSFWGWTSQLCRVVAWSSIKDYNVQLAVQEETAALYDKVLNVSPHTFFTGNFPDPTEQVPEAFNVELKEELYGTKNNILTKLIGTFSIPSGWVWYDHSEIWDSSDGLTYTRAVANALTSFEIPRVDEGATTYIKILPVSIHGVKRALADCAAHSKYIFGKTAKPAAPASAWFSPALGGGILQWSAVDEQDMKEYIIRYHPDPLVATPQNAIEVGREAHPTTVHVLPAAKSGVYFISAIDTTVNESSTAAAVITTIPTVLNWNALEELIENPSWTGTKTDMYVDTGKLALETTGSLWDTADVWALNNFWRLDSLSVATGYYESSIVDLGNVQTSRCSCLVKFSGVNPNDIFWTEPNVWNMSTVWDLVEGVGVQPQISLSQDGSTWDDWQPFFIGDYTARKIKFRVRAYAVNTYNYPEISELRFIVDMPDRTEKGQDVVIPSQGATITFSKPFMVKPKIGITIQSAAAGDYYELQAVSTTGFTGQTKNGSGTGITKTIDWEAKSH